MLDPKERYINFYTDFAFKRLFGTEVNKALLISFLNSLLNGEEVITDITYMNTERFGILEHNRKAVFDVYCKNDRDEHFIVEMQKGEQQFFKDRSVFYSTFPIRDQAPKGNWDYQLKAVYTVGILNFSFDDTDPEYYHHEVKLMDTRTKKVFYDKLTYIYLEMPKFNKSIDELVTQFDKWLYAIRHLPELLEKPKIMQEDVFTHLFEAAEIAKFTPQEVFEYEESLKIYRDWYSMTQTAIHKAKEEGIQQGIEKGREEGIQQGLQQGIEKGREEGIQQGLQQGIEKGIQQGLQQGIEKGIQQGLQQGIEKGREEGIQQGMEKGIQQGLQQGMEKGRKEVIQQMAKALIAEGMPIENISKITGLAPSEINKLTT